MAERTYIGETAYFPDLARWLEPGDAVPTEQVDPADPRFLTPTAAKKSAADLRRVQASAEPVPDPEES